MEVRRGNLTQFLYGTDEERLFGERVKDPRHSWTAQLTEEGRLDMKAVSRALKHFGSPDDSVLMQMTPTPDHWHEAGWVARLELHTSNKDALDMVKNLYNAASGMRREHRLNPADSLNYIEEMASWLVVHASGPQLNRRGIPPLTA